MTDTALTLGEVVIIVMQFGACAIFVSLFTPIPSWIKLRLIGAYFIAIWLAVLPTFFYSGGMLSGESCGVCGSIFFLPMGLVMWCVAKPDRDLRSRRPLR